MENLLTIVIIAGISSFVLFIISTLYIKKITKDKGIEHIKILYKKNKRVYFRLTYLFLTYMVICILIRLLLANTYISDIIEKYYMHGFLLITVIGSYFASNHIKLQKKIAEMK